MTGARVVAGVALVVVIAAIAVVLLDSGKAPYRVSAVVDDAGQLVPGNEVKLGGGQIGKVTSIKLTGDGRAKLDMTIDDDAAPLKEGTSLAIRAQGLLGSANHYVVLTPGAPSQHNIPDKGQISFIDAAAPVDIDALFDSLDKPTREGLRDFVVGSSQQYGSRAKAAQTSLKYLAPALSTSVSVLQEFGRDRVALNELLVKGAVAFRAVASRRSQLTDLITQANTTTNAIGDESAGLSRTLELAPGTLRQANTTLVNLRSTLDDLQPLVVASKPVAARLPGFLPRLGALLRESGPTVHNLALAFSAPGNANDLIDVLQRLPGLARLAQQTAPRAVRGFDRSQNFIDTLLQYIPDISAATARVDEAASYYDANGHYIRAQPDLFALAFNQGANQLEPSPNNDRLNGLQIGAGNRCPGSAAPPAPDGTNLYKVAGCKTSAVLPPP